MVSGDVAQTVEASREVILAAGTIHSAKLLMRPAWATRRNCASGGSPPWPLCGASGHNLRDHVLVSGVVYQYKEEVAERPADSNGVEAEVYLSSGVDEHPNNISLVLEQFPITTPEAAAGSPRPEGGFHHRAGLAHPNQPRGRYGWQARTGAMRR
jgi:choline dehydrogenase